MPRRYLTVAEREAVRKRAQGRCEYCQCWDDFASQSYEMEHIIPVSRKGKTDLDNLAYACGGCNGFKYNKVDAPDPADGSIVPLFHPRKDSWPDHFAWTDDFSLIVGLTPTGRATVEALRLNRPGVVNIRRILRSTGKHPPNVGSSRD